MKNIYQLLFRYCLAYAVIMLNTDQHNPNAGKNSVPMTQEQFIRSLNIFHSLNVFDQIFSSGTCEEPTEEAIMTRR